MILKPMGTPGKCPAHQRAWTAEEDELLISLSGKKTVAEIAALLPEPGRTRFATAKRIQVLRELYPDRVGYIVHRYTPGEDDFIRKNRHTMTIAEVAAHLNCSFSSVKSRKDALGVSFYKCGEKHSKARHPDSMVIQAQEWRDDHNMTIAEIARRLRVPERTVRRFCFDRLTADYAITRELLPR
ncbi:AsnC family protein [Salmonella enterica]|nr:AsnC family protein [Salmonella enterica]